VTTGWISNGIWWYENPGKSAPPGTLWQKHFITDSYDTEGGAIGDIDGEGHPDLVFAHYNHSGILWISFAGAKPEVHHVGGKEQDGHGIGIADIDGDGKADILTPYGWFQNIDAAHDKWQWHPDWHLGDAGFPILAYDVNHDGKMDIIYGQGHSYGFYWLQQRRTPSPTPSNSLPSTATAPHISSPVSAIAATTATTPAPTTPTLSTPTRSTAM